MTEIDPLGARLAIQNAQFALQRGQTTEARRLALQAVEYDPTFEDPWLILATLSSPRASVAYLQRALEINPHSERATKGMQWALDRLSKAEEKQQSEQKRAVPGVASVQPPPLPLQPAPTMPLPPGEDSHQLSSAFQTDADKWRQFREEEQKHQTGESPKAQKEKTQPIRVKAAKNPKPARTPQPPKQPRAEKKTGQKKGSNVTCLTLVILLFILLTAAVVLWLALPSWMALTNSASAALPVNVLAKPSLTPTNTATPTPTLTPTPTQTPTPLPTSTPQPTETPYPTAISQPVLYPTDEPNAPIDTTGRWIDVDLTNQMLYAYEDSTLVGSFLVSTGVAAHPTVTGQYYIYVKYTSTLMTGPGYYLPDVPYTMYFYEGYGIHGTYWHNNFGHPMSHGCVNMRTSDAEWLFNWASVGTLVNVHY